MATLKLSLTTNGAKNYSGKLSVKSTTNKGVRHYMMIQGLIEPKYDRSHWDSKNMVFTGGEYAERNNETVRAIMHELNELLLTGVYPTGKELFVAYKAKKEREHAQLHISFGEYLESLAEKMKKEGKSSNYELYFTLLHVLKGVNYKVPKAVSTFSPAKCGGIRIYDTPLSAIGNRHFVAFGDWITSERGGKGYRNLMTTFKAVVSRAVQEELSSATLTFRFRQHIPGTKVHRKMSLRQKIDSKGRSISVLSLKELEEFEGINAEDYTSNSYSHKFLAQLYKDTCLLLYYTKSRPVDILSMRHYYDYDEDIQTIGYIPRKLYNRLGASGERRIVTLRIPDRAAEIIRKYKGMSAGGYLLPFPVNNRHWNLDSDFLEWYGYIKHIEQNINYFLKRVAKELGFENRSLSMYDFRHSAITHAINRGENPFTVAREAGTSVVKIEQHYYNDIIK